jgi:diamine N-acetyltransferase
MNETQSEIRYRNGRPEDAEAIASLGRHIFFHSFSHLMPKEDLSKYLDESYSVSSITENFTCSGTTFVIAEQGDNVVAFMQLTEGSSQKCIDHIDSKIAMQRLYVSERYQGLGIGKKLMLMAEDLARSRGIKNIWLASWELNPKAGQIYEKAGYKTVGEMVFTLGDTPLKDWVMIKSIE